MEGGWNQQAQQQRQVPQVEDQVVGLLPLLAGAGVGLRRGDPWGGRWEGMHHGKEVGSL